MAEIILCILFVMSYITYTFTQTVLYLKDFKYWIIFNKILFYIILLLGILYGASCLTK